MKKRIIPSIVLRGGTNVVISQEFKPWRTVGALAQQLRLHLNRNCDELLIIDLDQASKASFNCSERVFQLIRKEVDIPIAYCGGIHNAQDAAICINAGFDKVYLTSAFLDNAQIVGEVARLIGSQSTGICLPYRRNKTNGNAFMWDYRTSVLLENMGLTTAVRSAIDSGAGEILLYNVDRDGALGGMDIDILADLEVDSPNVPILIAGGAGSRVHISSILKSRVVQGVVCGSIFVLTQETPATIRDHCEQLGIEMRRA